MQACTQRLNASTTRFLANPARATATAHATHAAPVRASASRSVPSSHARSAHSRNRSARNASSNDKLNAGMPTSTGSPVASKAAAETEDSVLCRSVEEKRTPLINL